MVLQIICIMDTSKKVHRYHLHHKQTKHAQNSFKDFLPAETSENELDSWSDDDFSSSGNNCVSRDDDYSDDSSSDND